MTTISHGSLTPRLLAMASPPESKSVGRQLEEAIPAMVAAGMIAIVGTAIRVWAGMDVIQTQIQALVKSDNQQNERIEQVRTEVNNLRVQVGVLRALGERK